MYCDKVGHMGAQKQRKTAKCLLQQYNCSGHLSIEQAMMVLVQADTDVLATSNRCTSQAGQAF